MGVLATVVAHGAAGVAAIWSMYIGRSVISRTDTVEDRGQWFVFFETWGSRFRVTLERSVTNRESLLGAIQLNAMAFETPFGIL
jgi:hypothetical protein